MKIPPSTNTKDLDPNILRIIMWPDDRLHVVCDDVETFDEQLGQLSLDMFATMKRNQGIGLAAPQIGKTVNVIAIWIENATPLLFVNPEIIETGEEMFEWEEGCLSVPGYFEKRERPERIVVHYKDVNGKDHETEFHTIYSFAIQHEIDHLHGRVFVDDLSLFKKSRVKSKVQKTLYRLNKEATELP